MPRMRQSRQTHPQHPRRPKHPPRQTRCRIPSPQPCKRQSNPRRLLPVAQRMACPESLFRVRPYRYKKRGLRWLTQAASGPAKPLRSASGPQATRQACLRLARLWIDSKTRANSRGYKYRFAHVPLGRIAMNRGAKKDFQSVVSLIQAAKLKAGGGLSPGQQKTRQTASALAGSLFSNQAFFMRSWRRLPPF